jgi:hypothetical protein
MPPTRWVLQVAAEHCCCWDAFEYSFHFGGENRRRLSWHGIGLGDWVWRWKMSMKRTVECWETCYERHETSSWPVLVVWVSIETTCLQSLRGVEVAQRNVSIKMQKRAMLFTRNTPTPMQEKSVLKSDAALLVPSSFFFPFAT